MLHAWQMQSRQRGGAGGGKEGVLEGLDVQMSQNILLQFSSKVILRLIQLYCCVVICPAQTHIMRAAVQLS